MTQISRKLPEIQINQSENDEQTTPQSTQLKNSQPDKFTTQAQPQTQTIRQKITTLFSKNNPDNQNNVAHTHAKSAEQTSQASLTQLPLSSSENNDPIAEPTAHNNIPVVPAWQQNLPDQMIEAINLAHAQLTRQNIDWTPADIKKFIYDSSDSEDMYFFIFLDLQLEATSAQIADTIVEHIIIYLKKPLWQHGLDSKDIQHICQIKALCEARHIPWTEEKIKDYLIHHDFLYWLFELSLRPNQTLVEKAMVEIVRGIAEEVKENNTPTLS